MLIYRKDEHFLLHVRKIYGKDAHLCCMWAKFTINTHSLFHVLLIPRIDTVRGVEYARCKERRVSLLLLKNRHAELYRLHLSYDFDFIVIVLVTNSYYQTGD